jgi:hypothetical protein
MGEAERAAVRPKYWAEAAERRPVKAARVEVVFMLVDVCVGLVWSRIGVEEDR